MSKKGYKNIFIGLVLFLGLMLLYSYRLVESFNYDNDFGRDIYDILGIARGNLRLLGPRLSFGGFISGPYYYYLFALPLFVFQENPTSVLFFSVFLYSLVFLIFYLFLAKTNGRLGSLLFVLWLASSSYLVFSVRNPGNAFSYFWLVLLFFLMFLHPGLSSRQPKISLCLGFIAGIICNFHFVNLIIFAVFWAVWFWQEKKKIISKLFFLLGGMVSFLPQLWFELRHDFVMVKNTFVVGSYQRFIGKELSTTLAVSKNPLENFFLMRKHINDWLQPEFLLIFTMCLFFYFINRHKVGKNKKILAQTTLLSFFTLVLAARFQFAFHYFLPFLLLFQLTLFFLIRGKWLKIVIFGLLFVFNIFNFPKSLYRPASRPLGDFELFVSQIISLGLVLPEESFNIFVVRETPEVVAGWEYRFFLKKQGFTPKSSFEYDRSDKMVVIAEPNQTIVRPNLKTWEFEQFGEYNVVREEQIGEREVMVLVKAGKPEY